MERGINPTNPERQRLSPAAQARKLNEFSAFGHPGLIRIENFPDLPAHDVLLGKANALTVQIDLCTNLINYTQNLTLKTKLEKKIAMLRQELDMTLDRSLRDINGEAETLEQKEEPPHGQYL